MHILHKEKTNNYIETSFLKKTQQRLIIDCLIYKRGKAYGYQEYLFNLLNYFYVNINLFNVQEIIIVCDKNQSNDFIDFADKFSIKSFNANSKIEQIISQNLLKYKLKLRNNDIILYTYNYSSFIKQGCSILVIHDLLFKRSNYLPNWIFRFHRTLFVPISIKLADTIISISNFTKNDIISYYKIVPSKVHIIYNYFNFNKFYPISIQTDVFPKYATSKYILSISSMAKHKNVITLLKAFEIFANVNSDTNLILVGSKYNMQKSDLEYLSHLHDTIKQRVYISGNISNQDLGFLYSNCECFVLPTLFEGLGMPIVEALFFNAPLVLSDIQICFEIAEDNAIFFSPLDYARLSEILISKEYKNILSSRKIKTLEKFNGKNTSKKYIELINKQCKTV